jgi:hypothetical protein
MKYYKLLKKEGYRHFKVGKIYKDIDVINTSDPVEYCVRNYPSDWQEVSAGDYLVQEGVMSEYFAIKRVASNPLWEKYIEWLNKTYTAHIKGNASNYPYYGFGGENIKDTDLYYAELTDFKNIPIEFTLEQWDQIINKSVEEFKLQEIWFIQLTEDNYDIVKNWHKSVDIPRERSYDIGSFYGINYGAGDAWGYNYLPENTQVITTEQFIKYILKQKVMKENGKEIIGWKLKDSCEQYEKAAVDICRAQGSIKTNLNKYAEGYNFTKDSDVSDWLRDAGVLDLWFEPVYEEEFKVGGWVFVINGGSGAFCANGVVGQLCTKQEALLLNYQGAISSSTAIYYVKINEDSYGLCQGCKIRKATPEEIKAAQTLKFGGYDVTFEKVTSGVRISCNGETGTLSQIEKIYDFITEKGKPFKFGSQELETFRYDDDSNWSNQYSDDCVELEIGCTTGTWKEFVAIYEKAKSML